jgi:isopentenyldiphosphate isomerase
MLDIIDRHGNIQGAAPRKIVHGNNLLLHRVVHVLVFDHCDNLLLQKRSMNKKVAPGMWDTSVGGHVDFGETIQGAMYREMKEELGICPEKTQFAYSYIHSNDFESEMVFTHVCRYSGKVFHNPDEIEKVRFWSKKDIKAGVGKKIFSDNFEDEFFRYLKWSKDSKASTGS